MGASIPMCEVAPGPWIRPGARLTSMSRRSKSFLAGIALACFGASSVFVFVATQRSAPEVVSIPDRLAGPDVANQLEPAARVSGGSTREAMRAAHSPALPDPVAPLAYAQAWDGPMPPAMNAFREWTLAYLGSDTALDHALLEFEGVALAHARRGEMFDLIASDPELALALTIPAAMRTLLPASVDALLETRVAGRGDYEILMAVQPLGSRRPEARINRVSFEGRSFDAYVYGRRSRQTSQEGASLHGIALDGRMAVHESPLRVLEPGEVVDQGIAAGPCPASGVALAAVPAQASANRGEATLVEVDGRQCQLASAELIDVLEADLIAAEDQPGPSVPAVMAGETVLPLEPTSWTTGAKSLLVIRVDFPDKTGDPVAYQTALDLMNNSVSPYFDASSYGAASIVTTVTNRTYRMPQTAQAYATGDLTDQLHRDATAAAGADYAVSGYDHVMVVFANLGGITNSEWTWAGLGSVGGGKTWINGWFNFRVTSHELGHNFGLFHANLWQVADGNPASPAGTSTEYGDPFDVMGGGSTAASNHFNPWFKNLLGWLPDAAVRPVTQSGTYRVTRFDTKAAPLDRSLALNVFCDGERTYWIGFRQSITNNTSLYNGAYVVWGFGSSEASQLLDMTTPGSRAQDAGLSVGASFVDTKHGVTIRPLARGGNAPEEYLDVEIILGQPANPFLVGWGGSQAVSASAGVTGIRRVVAGSQHGVGLRTDGTVTAWGSNTAGQTTVPSGLSGVVAVSARGAVSGAVRGDGKVVLWGDPAYGQTTPPAGLGNVTQLAIGGDHALALRSDGTVVAWGNNGQGESTVPAGLSGVVAIAAGSNVSYAVRSNGTVLRWGATQGTIPSGLSGVVSLSVGGQHALALRNDGTVVAWGSSNTYGQATVPANLSGVVSVAAGNYHSLALKADGTVVQWGYGGRNASMPVALSRVSAIAANDSVSLAIIGGALASSPTFVEQPADRSVEAGQAARFSVSVSGAEAPAFRWQRRPAASGDWTEITDNATYSGAGTATLTVSPTTTAMHGDQFRCVATQPGSSPAVSNAATLSVTAPLAITAQPASGSGTAGGALSLSVGASGPGELSYQWRLNGVDIAGANSATYTLGSLQAFHAGTYTVLVSAGGSSATSSGAEVTVAAAAPSTARPLNLSTRAMALAGEALIPGFVVEGTGTKRLLIRAVGPTLGTLGLGGTLADPQLTLTRYNTASRQFEAQLVNDDWGTNGNAAQIPLASSQVGAFPLPAGSADAAVLVDLAPGQYTVVASGKNNTAGLALVELYDADTGTPTARLSNISNRGFVGTGDALMIPGFVVSQEGSRTFLIRAVGPGLQSTFGLTGVLADPQLAIYKRRAGEPVDDLVLTNDNWDGSAGSTTTRTVAAELGAFPLVAGSRDAAFVVTLSPGIYTVHATGAGGTTGVALVEVYLRP